MLRSKPAGRAFVLYAWLSMPYPTLPPEPPSIVQMVLVPEPTTDVSIQGFLALKNNEEGVLNVHINEESTTASSVLPTSIPDLEGLLASDSIASPPQFISASSQLLPAPKSSSTPSVSEGGNDLSSGTHRLPPEKKELETPVPSAPSNAKISSELAPSEAQNLSGTTLEGPTTILATRSKSSISEPIPPLSSVVSLPPVIFDYRGITTIDAKDTSFAPSTTGSIDTNAFRTNIRLVGSEPIPPLSQVIALPPLASSPASAPMPVHRDVGLRISETESTEAAALLESAHTPPSSSFNISSGVTRIQFASENSPWGFSLPGAIPQAQITEPAPSSEVNESEFDAPESDPRVPRLNPDIDEPDPDNSEFNPDDSETDSDDPTSDSDVDEPGLQSPDADSDEPSQDAEPEESELDDPESTPDDAEAPEVTFPRGATPEPFWHNGGITNGGTLLPPSAPTNRPATPLGLIADYQEFEPLRQVVTARGDVVLRLGNGVLAADRLWANLFNRYVLVEGNVVFRRGQQVIEAERGEYNLLQGQGRLFDASGSLVIPTAGTDFGTILPPDEASIETPPQGDIRQEEPLGNVINTGGITFNTSGGLAIEGEGGVPVNGGDTNLGAIGTGLRRVRFEAEQVDFDAEGWVANDVRLTNDPFSPPELELRGNTVTYTSLNEFEDELFIENPRLVFDQGFTLPLFRERFIFRRGGTDQASPLLLGFGFDEEERGGLFLERPLTVVSTPRWELQVTPQLLVQRLTLGGDDEEDEALLSNFGLVAELDGRLSPTTTLTATADFAGLDLDNYEERLRASVRLQQLVGDHTLNLEYSFRDRLFNGSLGFQNVQSSLGAVLVSPSYTLGNTGIVLNYQVGAQYITALSDDDDLLEPFETEELVNLGRFQGNVSLARVFTLWQGRPLPPTRDEGLRFTPSPVVPNLVLIMTGRGTFNYYTNNDTQESLTASVGIAGQFGHFSRDFLDSTTFNLTYQRSFVGEGTSPFLFDRDVDRNTLSGGIIQQIYGPLRLGFQTDINLDTSEIISTDYILEYSRRTYSVVLRFNPERRRGFIGFRLNGFGWSGRAAEFDTVDVGEVEGGVVR